MDRQELALLVRAPMLALDEHPRQHGVRRQSVLCVMRQQLSPTEVELSEKEVRAVIFHLNRLSFRPELSNEECEAGLELLRQAGAENPAVKSWIVGPVPGGGEFDFAAVYVIEDLDAYWEYLTHPTHYRSEMEGIGQLAKFEAFDITDSTDPEIGAKIAQLQKRNYAEHPDLAALVQQSASFSVPDRE